MKHLFYQALVLRSSIPTFISTINFDENQFIIGLYNRQQLEKIALILRDSLLFRMKFLLDIFAIDHLASVSRFELFYCFLSVKTTVRLLLKLNISTFQSIPSLSFIFKSSNWLEREVWDLFGLFFENNPDLRRILSDYAFEGFALRKDFPLTGYLEVRYNETDDDLTLNDLNLTQAYRNFEFISPWTFLKSN